ncbi:MAG TPA: GTPase ObgE [Candidatus Paceibacterota bacterium]|nr:GTPase ObgE [Candidatus Paceibacterota bacterium]
MLLDEVEVRVEAGHGGRGAVAFQKVKMALGPNGGDGGRGGNVYFEGVVDIGALSNYASNRIRKAEDGKNGNGRFVDGRDGADLILKIPVGTRIINAETGFTREMTEVGQRILVAGGGYGGRGNFKFRFATNTSPQEFEEGKEGDRATYRLELRLIADVGLVGLPNAGKSSLLNELTAAHSKVANYAFTTLEPHLGSYYGLIVADIPGLIEGASEGKGLGTKFLRHIERTKTLFHLVAADSDDVVRDYKIVRRELETFNEALGKKAEHVFLSKSDAVAPEELQQKIAQFKKIGVEAMPLSLVEPESMDHLRAILNQKMPPHA